MKTLIANRIKSARVLSGYSLRELADKMDGIISHNAISKYEKAEMMPDSKVLTALSKALNVKTDYFSRPQNVVIENIEFRKASKFPQKKVNSLKENITDCIERYIELEQFLNFQTNFSNPIKNNVILNGKDVEEAVNQLLKEWELGFNALPNIIELLEDKEIKVVEINEEESFDGLSGWANQNIPIIVINKNFTIERKRFTALHELAHLVLNFHPSLQPKVIEKLCHHFAGAMLMPKQTFLKELGHARNSISINELIAVKETYGISIQAIMARCRNLEIISYDRYVEFRKWVNRKEEHKKEIGFGAYKGNEHSSRFKQLLYRATSEEIISMSKAASLANVKLAQFRDEFIAL